MVDAHPPSDPANQDTQLFGLFGLTHGWGTLLTVMSPQGAGAARAAIAARVDLQGGLGQDLTIYAGAGRLPQYHEKREGALRRLVEDARIVVLSRADWHARKQALGDAIYG